MSDTTCHMSISLDGFVAGPEQSRDNPLGKRGGELDGWHIGDPRATEADRTATGLLMRPRGAHVMGRNMFGPIRGEWNEPWDGWWGSERPYHAPVFVLTHHAREPIEMEGGTTFHFGTEALTGVFRTVKIDRRAEVVDAPNDVGSRSQPSSTGSTAECLSQRQAWRCFYLQDRARVGACGKAGWCGRLARPTR